MPHEYQFLHLRTRQQNPLIKFYDLHDRIKYKATATFVQMSIGAFSENILSNVILNLKEKKKKAAKQFQEL